MPSVDLESYNGQKVTICYDISGANASPRSLSNLKENLIGENVKVHRSRPDDLDMPSQQGNTKSKSSPALKLRTNQEHNFAARDSHPNVPSTPFGGSNELEENDGAGMSEGNEISSRREDANGGTSPEALEAEKVVFIAGLGARGRTEFFQHVVEHLASLTDSSEKHLMSVLTFDNRGIGGSTIFKKKKNYTTKIMAHDTLALIDYLHWNKVHLVGMSLGGMIANKFAAYWPERVASFTLISATRSGWQMLAGISRCPILAGLAGSGPLKLKILANLRFNFSDSFLEEEVDGRERRDILVENTRQAINDGDTKKFLAEGQPNAGREGHLYAVGFHRMKKDELKRIRESNLPCQLIVGRYDRLARVGFVLRLAQKMKAPLLILEAAHAGIVVEALSLVLANLESTILGNGQTAMAKLQMLSSATNASVLSDQMYAKEFASSFSPGRVSFKQKKSNK